jgi:hypothetical protein
MVVSAALLRLQPASKRFSPPYLGGFAPPATTDLSRCEKGQSMEIQCREDLIADWNLAVQGLPPQRIRPFD